MRAEIISVGTELLLGDISDTNSTVIARRLRDIGLDLIFRTTVGDNEQRIASAVSNALNRVDVVIITGGLGPTVDDVTREAVAQATGTSLEFHHDLFEQISSRFAQLGFKMSENNKRQAFVPTGSLKVENPVGTAPIFILQTDRGVILTLPGVPKEMEYLLDKSIIPWLKEYVGDPSVIRTVILRTAGIGESVIDAQIGDLMIMANPTVGLAAHTGQTDIRITAKARNEDEANLMIQPIIQEVERRVGRWIYGVGTESLEDAVAKLLNEQNASLAYYESGNHGLLHERLQHGLAKWPAVKAIHIEVDSGKESTVPLAAEIRQSQGTTYGLAVRQFLRSDSENSVRLDLSAASEDDIQSKEYVWTTTRSDSTIWVTTHGLALLWQLASAGTKIS